MAEENVVILKVGTDEAVKSVGDLKENIKQLKKQLDGYVEATGEVDEQGKKVYRTVEGLTIGSQEYKDVLEELKINQNALRDAMYATTASMEDVAKAATGTSKSYNSLVHQMAALKEEWRATNDEARRNELGQQIASINQQLKDMDASVGNFQRNVGNYQSAFDGLGAKFESWGATLKGLPPTLGATKESLGKVGETMQIVGKQPILGIIGLLAPIIVKITESLKGNQTAMDAVKKAMSALQPVFDFFAGILEKVAEGLSMTVDWLIKLAGEGAFDKFVKKVAGFGNAVLQYMLTPIKSAIAGVKGFVNIVKDVIAGDFDKIKGHAKEAGDGIAEAWKEGFSFKANFESGEAAGGKFVDGMKAEANKKKAKEAGKEVAGAFQEGYDAELERIKAENAEDAEAEAAHREEEAQIEAFMREQEWQKQRNDAWLQGVGERIDAELAAKQKAAEIEQAVIDANNEYIAEQDRLRTEEAEKNAEERKNATILALDAAASATSQILSQIADLYEQDGEVTKKEARKIKALRIASATIDMIQGAVTAFAGAMQLGPIAGPIVGGINAAAVTAMGLMNIAKIKNTNFETGGDSGGGSVSAPVSATVSAPNIETRLDTVRTATTASEEDRLNRMAEDRQVYILQSDIEASGKASKVQVKESSF